MFIIENFILFYFTQKSFEKKCVFNDKYFIAHPGKANNHRKNGIVYMESVLAMKSITLYWATVGFLVNMKAKVSLMPVFIHIESKLTKIHKNSFMIKIN